MSTNPKMFEVYCAAPNLKAACTLEVKSSNPRDCPNCGGIGTRIIFLATEGPYEFVPSGPNMVARSLEITIQGRKVVRWFGGKHVEEKCPVCNGLGYDQNYREPELKQRELKFANVLKEKAKEYTDV